MVVYFTAINYLVLTNPAKNPNPKPLLTGILVSMYSHNHIFASSIINGMGHVAGGHGYIDHEPAIADMMKYQDTGFTTWDLADIWSSRRFH